MNGAATAAADYACFYVNEVIVARSVVGISGPQTSIHLHEIVQLKVNQFVRVSFFPSTGFTLC